MNVEDSYEGAVRRLARLGHAGIVLTPQAQDHVGESDRVRDLEELATLACEDNERLTRELESARMEIVRLQQQVLALQTMSMSAQASEPDYAPRRGRSGAFYFFVIAVLGAGVAGLATFRPWERLTPAMAAASAATTATSAPVVTPPATPPVATTTAPTTTAPTATAPTTTPPTTTAAAMPSAKAPTATAPVVVPKVAPTVPKVAATIPTVVPATHATKHHAPKHHAAAKHHEKHGAAKSNKPLVNETDDPLGGTNL